MYRRLRPLTVALQVLAVSALAAAPALAQTSGTASPDGSRPLGILLLDRTANPDTGPLQQPAVTRPPAPGFPSAIGQQPAPPAPAADPDPGVDFFADQMDFDRENNVIEARGNVEINYQDRTLIADYVSYDQDNDVATARGNVTLIEPSGEVFFADEMELTSDLTEGIARNIGLILTDKARLAAVGAARSGGRITDLRKGVYSPCNLCDEDPSASPLWQIKAVRVIHDTDQRTIEYRDAWLEVMGIPVLYTPFFVHPDPTVVRESGFLAPSFGGSSDLGFVARIPYYYVIDETSDATFTPSYSEEEGLLVAAEYRKRFHKGRLDSVVSLTHASRSIADSESDDDEFRGHIDVEGEFDIDRTWRTGFEVERASDDTYLRRFGFDSPAVLNSRVYAEGFRGRNYLSVSALSFQDLRPSSGSEDSPNILPLAEFSHVGQPDRLGGNFVLDASFLSMTRETSGNDTHRISVRPSWNRRFNDALGSLVSFTAGVHADGYYVQNLERDNVAGTYDGVAGRIFPYGSIDWRFPLVRQHGEFSQTIEPIINAVVSPNGGNPNTIPNEDSREFEFDDTNLFGVNRFGGIDRVEGGSRINYGLKWGLFGSGSSSTTFLVGQTFRFNPDSTFAEDSGLEDDLSDIVASVVLRPDSWLDVGYRTQIDIDEFKPRRNELSFSVGVPALRFSGSYLFFEDPAGSEFSGREEINMSATSQLAPNWSTSANTRIDLEEQETRSITWNLAYEDECLIVATRFSRTFFEDRDLEPTDSFTINFTLKTLGQFGSG